VELQAVAFCEPVVAATTTANAPVARAKEGEGVEQEMKQEAAK